jgi:Fe2+ transport system protein FeoA
MGRPPASVPIEKLFQFCGVRLDPLAPSLAPPVPLARLRVGSLAVVDGVESGSPVSRRLLDLGFVPGTPVRVLRRAPLGDPTLYEVRGTRLCLRRTEAERVRVRPLPAGSAA